MHFEPRRCLTLVIGLLISFTALSAPLPRSTPEEQGVSSEGVLSFIQAADQKIDTMNSFMLVRHGHVVAEGWWAPYDANTNHEMYSLSKSFTSTAVGLAISEGKFTLNDPVLKFFPDLAPAEPSKNLQEMRVRDLLRMNTGQHDPDLQSVPVFDTDSPTKGFLSIPVAHKPGTHFLYNTPATYMLSAIVTKTTGMTVLDYLKPRLFEPLGIENPEWPSSKEGVTVGGFGLSIRTEDIARFGQLYLQKGQWQGKQLVPAAWVEAATALQTATGSSPTSDWDQGYGYQFWRSRHGYRGDGAFGQFCFVLPDYDAVVAITSGGKDMQAVMNTVWDYLLPALKEGTLPADAANQKKLKQTLSRLSVRMQQGDAKPRVAKNLSGRKFAFPANEHNLESFSLDWHTNPARPTMHIRAQGTEWDVKCAKNEWVKGEVPYQGTERTPVAATCAWTAPDTFAVKLVLYKTPFYIEGKTRFAGDQAFFDQRRNAGFGKLEEPTLIGKLQ
jgi:CubicO group peptidase (beta-lactamase class C family)